MIKGLCNLECSLIYDSKDAAELCRVFRFSVYDDGTYGKNKTCKNIQRSIDHIAHLTKGSLEWTIITSTCTQALGFNMKKDQLITYSDSKISWKVLIKLSMNFQSFVSYSNVLTEKKSYRPRMIWRMLSFNEIHPWLEEKILNRMSMYLSLFYNFFLLKKSMVVYLNTLSYPSLKPIFAKINRNWPGTSVEKDF